MLFYIGTARNIIFRVEMSSMENVLYAEQAQYHAVHGVDTRSHFGQQTTVQTAALSFPRRCLTDRPPYIMIGIGRNGADSEPSYGGGLSAHVTRQYLKGQSVNATFSKGVSVPTVRIDLDDTPESADACWGSCGNNNTGTP